MVRIIVAGPIRRFGRRLRDSEFRRDPKDQYDEKQFSHDPSRVEWPVYKNRNGHKKAQETQKFLCFAPFCGYKILPGRWSERSTDMTFQMSRRDLLRAGVGTAVAMNAFAGAAAFAQSVPVRSVPKDYKEDLFYREDWLGEPWRKPETAVLIHGNDESSTEWYAWVPRMAQQYRLIRPDLPGLGHSKVPAGFDYSLATLATFVTQVMDRAGIDSAHIIGAKTGGAVAMRLAADYPKRTRTLVVVGAPASPLVIADPSPIPQRDRLGSNASKEMIAYWNTLFSRPDREGVKGLDKALSNFDLAKEG